MAAIPDLFRLFQGNCLDEMNKIPKDYVNMVFADLPYGTTNCKWDTIIDLDLMVLGLLFLRRAILFFIKVDY